MKGMDGESKSELSADYRIGQLKMWLWVSSADEVCLMLEKELGAREGVQRTVTLG